MRKPKKPAKKKSQKKPAQRPGQKARKGQARKKQAKRKKPVESKPDESKRIGPQIKKPFVYPLKKYPGLIEKARRLSGAQLRLMQKERRGQENLKDWQQSRIFIYTNDRVLRGLKVEQALKEILDEYRQKWSNNQKKSRGSGSRRALAELLFKMEHVFKLFIDRKKMAQFKAELEKRPWY